LAPLWTIHRSSGNDGTFALQKRALKKKVWESKGWERGEQLPGGAQGLTFLARKRTDCPGEFNYVLKLLRRQEDPNRRAMFCGEIRNMNLLDHPGIVKVEDTNAEQYSEDEELYLITERITGEDFESRIREEVLSLADAVRLTVSVLHILGHCHSRGVVHRDIKPCHVILRNRLLTDPVLIDFGLAYNDETQPHGAESNPNERKGNTFVTGPEHLIGSPGANRTPASDIVQCLGLLYFALTKNYPGSLRAIGDKMPHEREPGIAFATDVAQWKRKAILRLLDRGFEWEPSNRWQSVDELVPPLEAVLADNEPRDLKLQSMLADIVRRGKTDSKTSRIKVAQQMAAEIIEVIEASVSLGKKQAAEFLDISWQKQPGFGATLASCIIHFRNKLHRSMSRSIGVHIELGDANDVLVCVKPYNGDLAIFEDNKPVTLGAYAAGRHSFESVRDQFDVCLTSTIAEVIGVERV
jgi:serine/threonine-protein kinase